MTARTTPDPVVLRASRGHGMTVQHTHESVTANIFVLGAETLDPTYMLCFGRVTGELPEDTEARWNRLAEQMWRMGVEPPEDEPFYTVVEDGVVWDHYSLRAISDRVSYDDERALHV